MEIGRSPGLGVIGRLAGAVSVVALVLLVLLFAPQPAWAQNVMGQTPVEVINQNLMHRWLAGEATELPGSSSAPGDLYSRARRMKAAAEHACGTPSEGADAIAAFAYGCPSILSPIVGDVGPSACIPEEIALSLRTIVQVGDQIAQDESCTAARSANDLILYLAESWSNRRWPTGSENAAYDLPEAQIIDPRMAAGYAYTLGIRDPDQLRRIIDTTLALEVANSRADDFTLTAAIAESEAETSSEFVPAAGTVGAEGGETRLEACDHYRASLVELARMNLPADAVALLVFPSQAEHWRDGNAIPVCHLPAADFTETRMVQLFSALGNVNLLLAPPMLKWWAVLGADDHFERWALANAVGHTRDDSVALNYIRATQRRADMYLLEHGRTDYNPDQEIPLSGRTLRLALDLVEAGKGAEKYDSIREEVAERVVAAMYTMERDEFNTLPVHVEPSGTYWLRSPWTRFPVIGTLTHTPLPSKPMTVHPVDLAPEIFEPRVVQDPAQALSPFCTFQQGTPDQVDLITAHIADLAARLDEDVAAKSCSSFPVPPGATGIWTSEATYRLAYQFYDQRVLIEDKIPAGPGPNLGQTPGTEARPAPTHTPTCVWKVGPAYDVIEALGYDRLQSTYRKLAAQAAQADGSDGAWYQEIATSAKACEAKWMKGNNLPDVAALVGQDRGIAGRKSCDRRRYKDLTVLDEANGRATLLVDPVYSPVQLSGEVPEDQHLAAIIAEDILGRAVTGMFPITECSGWEVELDHQVYVAVRAPTGSWTSADGAAWTIEASPTWIPNREPPPPPPNPHPAPIDSDGDGIVDTDDRCPKVDAKGFDADGDGCIDAGKPGSNNYGLARRDRSLFLAGAIGFGAASAGALLDGGFRLGNGVQNYESANAARATSTPASWMQNVDEARTGQAIGGMELAGGVGCAALSAYFIGKLLAEDDAGAATSAPPTLSVAPQFGSTTAGIRFTFSM